MAADSRNGDRWLGAYRATSAGLLATIMAMISYLGVNLLDGQTKQAALLATLVERVDQNKLSTDRVRDTAEKINDRVNVIDNRLSGIEGAQRK